MRGVALVLRRSAARSASSRFFPGKMNKENSLSKLVLTFETVGDLLSVLKTKDPKVLEEGTLLKFAT